jgi:hypothetical protein
MKSALSALLLAMALPAAAATTVTYVNPERFTDVGRDRFHADREDYLAAIQSHLVERADATVPADARLQVWITDVDMAGDFEPWRTPRQDVRVIRDLYPPRINLRFRLEGPDGRVLKEGERSLIDQAFLQGGAALPTSDPVRYEEALLDRWLSREFGAPRSRGR